MARKPEDDQSLFPTDAEARKSLALRRRRPLILPRFLDQEGKDPRHSGFALDAARRTLSRWADLESQGHLQAKETALSAQFLQEVFGQALGYASVTESPEKYYLEHEYTIPGVGTADAALGCFSGTTQPLVHAVVELKAANTDLDRDRFNGRTPVQQCWDYLNALPGCPWGIVSNFVSIRLYHRDKTPLRFESFALQELRDPIRFQAFFALFERHGLIPSRLAAEPLAIQLLRETDQRQKEIGDELYDRYSQNRLLLIDHLHTRRKIPVDEAIRIAQKLIDRIIFVAFCEDRELLPSRTIETVYKQTPPLSHVTNPRWQNFLDLFAAVDRGHPRLGLRAGYNGGLFRRDPEVDDLQLEDEWTDFFHEIGGYDFRDEVNVDVLGHLFERSVTELEKLRHYGLFEATGGSVAAEGKMPKSAQRKRLGIYYTPPAFTQFLVKNTLGHMIDERLGMIAATHQFEPDRPASDAAAVRAQGYVRDALAALRDLKVCDPACGSGAFLIQAYDVLEERYAATIDLLAATDSQAAADLSIQVPDWIMGENLYGVDLSVEAVEITQLALWLRSARRGRTLADLSGNIVCGNSLVADSTVDPRAMRWHETFPAVFARDAAGFDVVIGNPPWERLKVQEREFFSLSAPKIAEAVNAANRRKLIARLASKNPALFDRYEKTKDSAERMLAHVRASGQFPLTAKGDVNTYTLFAELARKIVAPGGRVGLLLPSGIATDHTTRQFFEELIESRALVSLHDFENKDAVFPDVHRSFKFCTFVFGGRDVRTPSAGFVFFARNMEDVYDERRHIRLSPEDFALFNPNTRTCPIFRSRRDAELTRAIYRRVPVLVEHARGERGNPWGVRFFTMFHQTNDAELFHTAEQLSEMGLKLKGHRWTKGKRTFLPLYEAKMIQMYDHRAAGVVVDTENWMRQGQTVETSLVAHQKPEFAVQPRWWVDEAKVLAATGESRSFFLGFKDITSPTNERTMIASLIPWSAVTNHFPLVRTTFAPRRELCLLANLNAFVLDYVARQKIGGVTLNYFIVEQFSVLPPDAYADRCPWNRRQTLERWISDRVLKLTCTADDMRPLAEACGFDPPVHKWKPLERRDLMAELDAAYFILYGLNRDDAVYVLSTFVGTRRKDEAEIGDYRTADKVLEAYDRLVSAM